MKVVFLKDVAGVGQKGSIKNVTDGYAINYLIPQRLAEIATDEKIAQIEAAQKADQEKRTREQEQLAQSIKSISGSRVHVSLRATEKGGLFKALHEAEVAAMILKSLKVHVPASAIALDAPIKTTGEHQIHVKAGNENVPLTIVVAAAE